MSSWLLASLVGVVAHASAQGIARAVAAAEALGARTGVAVCDAGGRWLFRHAAGDAFAPASNMKVLTAAAVVNGLGADFHFTTTFALRGGRLVVVASGEAGSGNGQGKGEGQGEAGEGAHDPRLAPLTRAGVTAR